MRLSFNIFSISLLAIFLFGFQTAINPISYKINSSSAKVSFIIKNAGLNVDGEFSGLSGTINFDKDNPSASKIEASIPVKSVDTGINKRDEHLRGEDYFEVEKYPNIRFVSTKITSKDDVWYNVTGNFTIKETTKSVTIPFTFSNNVFVGKFNIDRRDYGVGGNSWIMGDKVKISFEIPVEAL
ncbi:MAG: YceI family protein [Bacteroidota bacterium]